MPSGKTDDPTLPAPHLLTPTTLGERWGVSSQTIRDMIGRGEIRHFRAGKNRYRIPLSVVEEIEACNAPAEGAQTTSKEPVKGISGEEFARRSAEYERRHGPKLRRRSVKA